MMGRVQVYFQLKPHPIGIRRSVDGKLRCTMRTANKRFNLILAKWGLTMLLHRTAVLILLSVAYQVVYAQATVRLLDEACLADAARTCSTPPMGWIQPFQPGMLGFQACQPNSNLENIPGIGCVAMGKMEILSAIQNYCYAKVRNDPPANCIVTVSLNELTNEVRTVAGEVRATNSTLKADMRSLLTQFCKTYAQNTAKCDELLTPPAGAQ